ncbi:MAG: cytochrome P450 [Chloroflexi bacterium]|nr:cytochrome P450 [Chloroflexota bacterium]MBV9600488.1 cytochrome P450 [Chloroflexota bacterium]
MTVVDNINLLDLDIFERGQAHEVLRTLRHEAPVYWNEGDAELRGFWNVLKYEDVKFVSSHPELFSSTRGITGPGLRDPENNPNALTQPGGVSIITMDPPRHVKVRRLVNRGFTPRAVNAMEPKIREIAIHILDRLADRAECDFVLDVASQLPLAVICGLMGVPEPDWPLMFQLTNLTLGAADPEYQAQVLAEEERGTLAARSRTALAGRLKMTEFFRDLLEERRKTPGDDLVNVLMESEVDGEKLSESDILAFCFLLVVAGNETTRNAISGGLWVLCEHPEERARLQADMSLLDSAVDEILRWTSPLHHMARRTTAEVEVRGQKMQADESVLMWYPSANRDEDVFTDPYRFDITRSPNDHLAFGHHEHYCLGAEFARKEIRVMFEELFARYPRIELNGKPERLRSNFINGIKRMPVRLR